MTATMTCYERDEAACQDQRCLSWGCRLAGLPDGPLPASAYTDGGEARTIFNVLRAIDEFPGIPDETKRLLKNVIERGASP